MRSASFEGLLASFLEARRRRALSPRAETTARYALSRLFEHLRRKRVRDIRAVSAEHLSSFAAALARARNYRGQPLASATREGWLSVVKVFFGHLVRTGVLLANPAAELVVRREHRLPRRVLSHSEARRLMAAPSPVTRTGKRDRAILEVLYGTGIRVGECARLDLSDVDTTSGHLLIRNAKGKKDRYVPLSGRAAVAIEAYLREARPELLGSGHEAACFLSRTGGRLTKYGIQIQVNTHARKAGLRTPFGPHALRHTCATHLLKGGADVRHIQELLGHASVSSTMVYTRVEVKDLHEVLEKSHPRERARTGPVSFR